MLFEEHIVPPHGEETPDEISVDFVARRAIAPQRAALERAILVELRITAELLRGSSISDSVKGQGMRMIGSFAISLGMFTVPQLDTLLLETQVWQLSMKGAP